MSHILGVNTNLQTAGFAARVALLSMWKRFPLAAMPDKIQWNCSVMPVPLV